MSVTGPGCPACDYDGRTTLNGKPLGPRELHAIPCGACSPWSHPPDFPDAALRAKAADILASRDAVPFLMREWALRLTAYAADVDAERAAANVCEAAPRRCVR